MDFQAAIRPHAAPARPPCDLLRQSGGVGEESMPGEHGGEWFGGSLGPANPQPGRREPQPSLAHVMPLCDGSNSSAARDGSLTRQAVASVSFVCGSCGTSRCARSSQRRAAAMSPAAWAAMPRSNALRASATTAASDAVSRAPIDQSPAARAAFSCAAAVASGAGGSAARSALASCIPCATARSVQRLASSISCSPASLRAR